MEQLAGPNPLSRRSSRKGGFTLIELMIAVAIIGILCSIAAGLFRNYAMRAKQSEARELLSSIFTSETAYYADQGTYALPSVAGFAPAGAPRFYTNIGDTNFTFSSSTFVASCSTNLDGDALMDVWEVTELSRRPDNSQNDIP